MTASVPRKYLAFATVVSAVIIVLGIGIAQRVTDTSGKMIVSSSKFTIEYASTEAARQLGLSGRDGINEHATMLFTFPEAGRRCFWMKDMKFNIDMVWIDGNKRVVAIESNVPPDSYPQNFCHDNAQYVAEFSAGTTQKLGLKTGDTLQF